MGFKTGFAKIANTAADRSKISAIGNTAKKFGKHLHKYRKEYIMGTSAAAATSAAHSTNKMVKENK